MRYGCIDLVLIAHYLLYLARLGRPTHMARRERRLITLVVRKNNANLGTDNVTVLLYSLGSIFALLQAWGRRETVQVS